jgi:hypothetical protein
VLASKYGDLLNVVDKRSSAWWRDLNLSLRFSRTGGEMWFDENITKVVRDGKNDGSMGSILSTF